MDLRTFIWGSKESNQLLRYANRAFGEARTSVRLESLTYGPDSNAGSLLLPGSGKFDDLGRRAYTAGLSGWKA
jgi:hypothetical protein